jgi:hypothetical protein
MPTVIPLSPIRLAMDVLVAPAPQAKMICDRCTSEWGNDLELVMLWSC